MWQTRARLHGALASIQANLDKAAEKIVNALNEDGQSNLGFGGWLSQSFKLLTQTATPLAITESLGFKINNLADTLADIK